MRTTNTETKINQHKDINRPRDINSQNQFRYWFKNLTSYDMENFTSYNSFINWLHRPTDAAALGIFRLLFGIAMLIDIPEEREGGHIDTRFGDPKTCHFPLFDSIKPLSLPHMGMVYLLMWLGALGIALGYKFKLSCLLFSIPYWYIFLLEKPAWNNHSYLYGLCGILLLWTESHKFCSIDYWKLPREKQNVPYWNYFLIKFQFFILYFYAGLKKLTVEWLSGYSMINLGYHWLFIPFRYFMSVELIELIIIHWTTALFDVSIAFLMTWKRTRVWVTPFMLMFHLMNSRLFSIGMFPWVCLAEVHLFFSPSWVRNIFNNKKADVNKVQHEENSKSKENMKKDSLKENSPKTESKDENNYNLKQKLRICIILMYCIVQMFLPYSHFITKGYNNWTNGLYGYSWDMMVHSYDTISVSIKIIDNENKMTHFMNPYAFTQYDRWTKHADMAYQYAKCIKRNILKDIKKNRRPVIKSSNFSIYFDIWCSMNGRFQQRVYNPKQDILKAEWSPFKETSWSLPLLNELNYMRPKLNEITNHVLSWSNYSDVLFIADFPGLTLDNYISPELFNVTLNIINGTVEYINKNITKLLKKGESLKIPSGHHEVLTKDDEPSCYMYTFVNQTMLNLKEEVQSVVMKTKWLAIGREISERIENYKYFFYNVGNSILFLLYGVPMPIRLRED